MSWNKLTEAELAYTGFRIWFWSVSNSAFNNGYYLVIQTACILDSSVLLFKHLENKQTKQLQL